MIQTDNHRAEEHTIGIGKAQLGTVAYFVLFSLLFGLPYYLLWGFDVPYRLYRQMASQPEAGVAFIPLVIIVVGVFVHELLHGLTWVLIASLSIRSIHIGILWKWVTPYCHCKVPIRLRHYMIGALMPGLLLGVIPTVAAICIGNFPLFLFGFFFTVASSGDFMMVTFLRKEPMDTLVQDHPSAVGCYIYRKATDPDAA